MWAWNKIACFPQMSRKLLKWVCGRFYASIRKKFTVENKLSLLCGLNCVGQDLVQCCYALVWSGKHEGSVDSLLQCRTSFKPLYRLSALVYSARALFLIAVMQCLLSLRIFELRYQIGNYWISFFLLFWLAQDLPNDILFLVLKFGTIVALIFEVPWHICAVFLLMTFRNI